LKEILYLWPVIPGRLPGMPAVAGTGLQVSPDGQTVYDPQTDVTWIANANLAATNRFGLPLCTDPTTPALCVVADGSMTWDSAAQFLANMNSAAWLGQTHWVGPSIAGCSNYNCGGTANPMGNLYYGQLTAFDAGIAGRACTGGRSRPVQESSAVSLLVVSGADGSKPVRIAKAPKSSAAGC